MGSVNAKPIGSRIRRLHIRIIPVGLTFSALFPAISSCRSCLAVALASAALPFLIIFHHNSPFSSSLSFFLFDSIPRLWRYSSDHLFTPRNLFLVLNLIILSIFAMNHFRPTQPEAAAAHDNHSTPQQHPAHDNGTLETFDEAAAGSRHSVSTEIEWIDVTSSDLSGMESTGKELMQDLNADNQSRHTDHKDNNIVGDNQGQLMGRLVIKEELPADNLQLLAVDNYERQYCTDHHEDWELKRKADKKSRQAEKEKLQREDAVGQCAGRPVAAAQAESKEAARAIAAAQGSNGRKADHIGLLLHEKGSIFSRAQSRPLPSARFTHKKSAKQPGADRPLSPMRLSRPILKRGDTLEATWKAICESQRHSSPLTRHGHFSRRRDSSGEMLEEILMHSLHKDELARAAIPLTRREPSMAQEELHAKVESFISRFHERIRIQREKSLRDSMEMVGRGAK